MRKDLNPAQIAVQASHAAIEIARTCIPVDQEHPSIVLCGIKNEKQLLAALNQLRSEGILCKEFREADLGHELTAFATTPIYGEDRKRFRKFQLLKTSDFHQYQEIA